MVQIHPPLPKLLQQPAGLNCPVGFASRILPTRFARSEWPSRGQTTGPKFSSQYFLRTLTPNISGAAADLATICCGFSLTLDGWVRHTSGCAAADRKVTESLAW